MSASNAEVHELASRILELLGVRIHAGQLVIHFSEDVVQRCEVNTVHKVQRRRVSDLLDKGNG